MSSTKYYVGVNTSTQNSSSGYNYKANVETVETSSLDKDSLEKEETSFADFRAGWQVDQINQQLSSDYNLDSDRFSYEGRMEDEDGDYKLCISDSETGLTLQIDWSGESTGISDAIKSALLLDETSQPVATRDGAYSFDNEDDRNNYIEKCEAKETAEHNLMDKTKTYIEKLEKYTHTKLDKKAFEDPQDLLEDAEDLLDDNDGNLSRAQKAELKSLLDDVKAAYSSYEDAEDDREEAASYGIKLKDLQQDNSSDYRPAPPPEGFNFDEDFEGSAPPLFFNSDYKGYSWSERLEYCEYSTLNLES